MRGAGSPASHTIIGLLSPAALIPVPFAYYLPAYPNLSRNEDLNTDITKPNRLITGVRQPARPYLAILRHLARQEFPGQGERQDVGAYRCWSQRGQRDQSL